MELEKLSSNFYQFMPLKIGKSIKNGKLKFDVDWTITTNFYYPIGSCRKSISKPLFVLIMMTSYSKMWFLDFAYIYNIPLVGCPSGTSYKFVYSEYVQVRRFNTVS